MLHLRGQPAIAADPAFDLVWIDRHQFGGAGDAGHLGAGGPALVVVGLVEAEARARRHAHAPQWHDPEHQRAGRIAHAVNDDALLRGGEARILGLVGVDEAAVVARDAHIGRGRPAASGGRQDQHGERGEAGKAEPAHALPRSGSSLTHAPSWRQKLAGPRCDFVKACSRAGARWKSRKALRALLPRESVAISRPSHTRIVAERPSGGAGPKGWGSQGPRRLNRRRPWRCPISRCASCWKLASISAIRPTAGIRRCRITSSGPATTSTSSIWRRPCRCSIAPCRR